MMIQYWHLDREHSILLIILSSFNLSPYKLRFRYSSFVHSSSLLTLFLHTLSLYHHSYRLTSSLNTSSSYPSCLPTYRRNNIGLFKILGLKYKPFMDYPTLNCFAQYIEWTHGAIQHCVCVCVQLYDLRIGWIGGQDMLFVKCASESDESEVKIRYL
jgi:hypothetical protein